VDATYRTLANKFDKIINDGSGSVGSLAIANAMTEAERKDRNDWGCAARLRLFLGQPPTLENVQKLWAIFSEISMAEQRDRTYGYQQVGSAFWRDVACHNSCLPFLKANMYEEDLKAFVLRYPIGTKPVDIDDIPYGSRELENL
jgi:hypothetical protein